MSFKRRQVDRQKKKDIIRPRDRVPKSKHRLEKSLEEAERFCRDNGIPLT